MVPTPPELITDGHIWAALQALPAPARQQFFDVRDNGDKKFSSFTHAFSENSFATPHGQGCYVLLSRFNHSCLPNAKIPDTGLVGDAIACFATRGIAEGEEVTFCYNTDFMCRTSLERRRELRFVCECAACMSGTVFHGLSDMRRSLLRGLHYLSHGSDIDGKRHADGRAVVVDPGLKKAAEKFDIGVANRLVCSLLTIVLLEQEGLLDQLMLERLQPGIRRLAMSFRTRENIMIVKEAIVKASWAERFCAALKLWGKSDAGDGDLTLQLQMANRLQM